MAWFAKISLTVLFLFLPNPFTSFSPKSALCFLTASANQIVGFGKDGKEGIDGKDGSRGRDSEALTIFADGSPLNLNLSGQQGTAGENGGFGENALCDNQPINVNYNLVGANGGEGGSGGNGGDGGNGGSLTIYATDRNFLRQIYVSGGGGKGGSPGEGGRGGQGCQCPQPYWTVESCTGRPGSPDYSCGTKEFRCINGETGKNGRSGRTGRDGKLGSLTLINTNQPLPPDRLTGSVTMNELKNRGFSLSKNVWESRTGAVNLFASGSIIDDQYLELVERVENAVVLIWNAPQVFAPFGEQIVTLNLQDDRNVNMTFPQDLWLETNVLQRNNVTELYVFNAIRAQDAVRLKSNGIREFGQNLQFEIVDEAQQSDIIATDFYIRYSVSNSPEARLRPVSDYTLRFEGEIPPQFVRYANNRFILDIGQLSIDPRHLDIGRAVQIQIEAKRTFSNYTATQTLVERTILGPFK
ncbi:collagen-like protein [Geminocystis sp. CENA526]|uniref:collagen-like protein n=1 Tax=Geminocystis sp. CENA526 TaxID=1355871 RepID=UPI003D6FCEEB